ncbi:MAG: hypothetical protein C0475_01395 [Planctomyces sp.]|nr:hypothetical protein [Planctomyces sp.]
MGAGLDGMWAGASQGRSGGLLELGLGLEAGRREVGGGGWGAPGGWEVGISWGGAAARSGRRGAA